MLKKLTIERTHDQITRNYLVHGLHITPVPVRKDICPKIPEPAEAPKAAAPKAAAGDKPKAPRRSLRVKNKASAAAAAL